MMTLRIAVVLLLACGLAGGEDMELKTLRAENKALRAQVAKAAPIIEALRKENAELKKQLGQLRRLRAKVAVTTKPAGPPLSAKRQELVAAVDALIRRIAKARNGALLHTQCDLDVRRLQLAAMAMGFRATPVARYSGRKRGLCFTHPWSGATVEFDLVVGRAFIPTRGPPVFPASPLADVTRGQMISVLRAWIEAAKKPGRR